MEFTKRFHARFQSEADALSQQTLHLKDIPTTGGERKDATDFVLAGISRLTNEVADAAEHTSDHDRMIYNKVLKALREQLDAEIAKLAPKSRFAFKPKTQTTDRATASNTTSRKSIPDDRSVSKENVTPNDNTGPARREMTDSVGELPIFSRNYNEEISKMKTTAGVRKPSFSAARDISLSDHSDIHIILPSTASRATSSGTITNISKSIIDMSVPTSSAGVPFASLALRNIDKSLIVAGHVDGPAHITGVTDSIVIVNSRQVRIHECRNVDFYLYCTSHPIIEDCSRVRFAPIPPYHNAGSNPAKNQWDQVDDFKWIKNEPSPNWNVLPEESRMSENMWSKTVAGEQALNVGEILSRIGVPGN